MWSRGLLVFALVAGVGAAYVVDAKPKASETSSKSKKSKKSKKTKKSKKKTAKAHAKKKKTVSRTPSKKTLRNLTNMPRGYQWPPSKQMLAAEKACAAELAALGVKFKPAKREGRIVSALTVEPDPDGHIVLGGIKYKSAWRSPPYKMDCQLALALESFGQDLYTAGVREVKFGSIFRWTNVRVNGETKPILSRHALGIAMDIVSFSDEAGREANVKADYPLGDPLLLAVEAAVKESGRFRTLLTPQNDPVSHSDHFHIEVAVDYTAKK
ncbi:MAG: extensin family protein [Kofleriaceae bacterium]